MPAPLPDHAGTVRVWDPLVRLFHWCLVAAFGSAYLLGEDGGPLHQRLGYVVLGLVALRLLWGVVGSRHARFRDFVPSPAQLMAYLRDSAARREKRYLGHNPAGGAMIVALLLALATTGLSGWLGASDAFWGAEWLQELHELAAHATLLLAGLHVAGVAWSSLRHRENLVRAMFTGKKRRR